MCSRRSISALHSVLVNVPFSAIATSWYMVCVLQTQGNSFLQNLHVPFFLNLVKTEEGDEDLHDKTRMDVNVDEYITFLVAKDPTRSRLERLDSKSLELSSSSPSVSDEDHNYVDAREQSSNQTRTEDEVFYQMFEEHSLFSRVSVNWT